MSKKSGIKNSTDRACFVRSEVVAALGEPGEKLPDTHYVRQRHIRAAYGFGQEYFRKLIRNSVLTEKHFVFEN